MLRKSFRLLALLPLLAACSASPQQIERQIKNDLLALDQAVNQYARLHNEYPGSLHELAEAPDGRNLLAGGTSLSDPYGNPYGYTTPDMGGQYDLFCFGADGAPGGEDESADTTLGTLRSRRR